MPTNRLNGLIDRTRPNGKSQFIMNLIDSGVDKSKIQQVLKIQYRWYVGVTEHSTGTEFLDIYSQIDSASKHRQKKFNGST
jgi:hypothetical protein